MKKLKKFGPAIVYSLLIFLALFISIVPDIYRVRITPAGTTFPLIHNHPEDYFSYLSYMRTGYEGKWLITTRVTSEHFPPKFVYTFYVVLGQLSRIFHINLPLMYFLARIVSGILVMVLILAVIKRLFKEFKYRALACILVFFGTGFWTAGLQNGKIVVVQFLSFWTHFDPVLRTTFLPHHLAAIALGILSLIFLEAAFKRKSVKVAAAAGLLGFLSGLNYHGTLTNILGGVAIGVTLAAIFWIIQTFTSVLVQKKPQFLTNLSVLATYLFISSLSLLYILYLTHTTWPWSWSRNLSQQFSFFVSLGEYIAVLGPTLILTAIGLPLLFVTGGLLAFLLLGWAAFPFVGLFFLIYIFPQFGNMPYLEGTSYIPLGILAVYGVKTLEAWLGEKLRVFPIVLFSLLLYSAPPIVSSVYNQLSFFTPYYYNQYLPNEVIAGFDWLDNFSPKASVVLAGGFMGAIIPAYTHNYMVFGDPVTTYRASEKSGDMDTFFSQKDIQAAAKIIQKYNIAYIFYGPDTSYPDGNFTASLGLVKTYSNSRVTIFKTPTE